MEQLSFKGKVLIIDDTISIIDMVKTALIENKYQVLVATSGSKGIKSAIKAKPDLILLDILMPEMDGYETCKALKKEEATQDIPVIFMSALSEVFDKVKAFNIGAVDYITKPLNVEELLARVGTQVSLHLMQQQLKDSNAWLEKEVEMRTKELQESHNRYQTVADFTHDWEYWMLPNGNIEYMSPSCEHITGYTVEEFTKSPNLINDIIHTDDKSIWQNHIDNKCIEEVQGKELSYRIITKDKQVRWIGHVYRQVFDFSGNFNGTRVSNRDVTKIKEVEEAILHKNHELQAAEEELRAANDALKENIDRLHESEELLKESQKVGKVASWEYDFIANKLTWSDEVFRMLGFEPNAFKPSIETYTEYIHPDDRDLVSNAYQKSVSDKAPYEVEHRFVRHDTKEVTIVRERGENIYDEKGSPVKSIGMTIDITTQKRSEQRLKEKNEELQAAEEELKATNDELRFNLQKLREHELQLKEQYEKNQSILRAAPTGIGMTQNRVIVEINPQIEQITGYSTEEIIGEKSDFLYLSIEEFEKAGKEKYELIKKFGTGTVETKWKRKDGKTIDIQLASTPIDLNDLSKGVTFTALDITERKDAERRRDQAMKELNYEKELLHSLMNNIPDTIYFKDTQSCFTRINKAQAIMLGEKNTEDAIGKTDFDYFPKDHAKEAYNDERKIVETGEPVIDKLEVIKNAKGETRYVSSTKVPILDSKGKVISIVGATRDITEHKIIENKLLESEGLLKKSQAIAHVGSWAYRSENDQLTWSDETYRIFGYQPNDNKLTFDFFMNHVHPDDRKMVTDAYDKSIENKESGYQVEHRLLKHSTKETIYVVEKCQNIFNEKGEFVQSIGMVMDITKRKIAELNLEKTNNELKASLQLISDRENAISNIVNNTMGKSGNEFFSQMALTMREATQSEYTFIGALSGENSMKTLALIKNSEILENFEYSLEGTPCDKVMDHDTCIYTDDVCRLFPKDKLLVDLGVMAYIGTSIRNKENERIGIIASMYTTAINESSFSKSLFETFAGKIGAEMERLAAEKALIEKNEELQAAEEELIVSNDELRNNVNLLHISELKLNEAQSTAHIGHWEWNVLDNTLIWSDEIFNIFGVNKMTFEVSAENFEKTIHPDDLAYFIEQREKGFKSKKEFNITHRIVRPNGEIRYVEERTKTEYKNNKLLLIFGIVQDITEIKLAELELLDKNQALQAAEEELLASNDALKENLEKLAESETRFKALHNASFGGIAIHDMGIILETNQGMAEMTGFSYEELIGMNGLLLISEATRNIVLEKIKAKHEKPYEAEGVRKDGSTYPLRLEGRQIPYKGKEVRVVEFRDISEQKEAERLVRENEERYRNLQENMQSGVVVYKPIKKGADFEIVGFNKSGEKISGINKENAIGKSLKELFPGIEHSEVFTNLQQVNKTGKVITMDANKTFDPKSDQFTNNQFYKLPNGEVVAIFDDVTEKIKAELSLKQSEERFRTLAENTPGVIYLCNNDTKYSMVYLNDAVKNLTGYNKEDFYSGKINFVELYHPNHASNIRLEVDKALEKKTSFRLEYKLKTKRGEWRWIEEYGAGIFEGDNLQFIEGSLMDITERKTNELINQSRLLIADYSINHSAKEVLRKTIDETEKLTNSTIGFYHFVNEDKGDIHLHEWSTNTIKNMCTAASVDAHYPVKKAGVWVDCIHKRKAVIHNNYENLKHKKGLPDGHALIIREVVVPVFRNKKIVAVLGVGNKPNNYTKYDVQLIEQLADLGFETVLRKQIEEQILEERNRTLNIIEGTNAGTWQWNVQTGHTIFNQRWAEIIGYGLNELEPTDINTWMKFAHSDDLDQSNKLLQKHFSGELDYYECEARMKHKDGTWRWVLDRGKVISWSDDGKPLWMFGTHVDITERKEVEIALHENEEQLQLIFDSSPAIMFLVDNKKEIVRMNQTGLEFLNTDIDQIIGYEAGKAFNCIVSVQDKMRCGKSYACKNCAFKTAVENVLNTQQVQNKIETKLNIIHNNKIQAFTVLVSTSVATVEPDLTYLVTVDDISERKKTENALRKSEERFKDFVNSVTDVYFALNHELKYIFWNKACELTTGKKASEVLGKSFYELDINKNSKHIAEKYKKCMQNGISESFEVSNADDNTETQHYIVNAYPTKSGIIVYLQNITQRKTVENALKESETRFRKIIELANDAIYISNANTGEIVDVNKRGEDLMGLSKELIIGIHISELHPENERQQAKSEFASKKVGAKDLLIRELNIQHISGILIPVEISPAKIKLIDDKEYVVGFYRDITKRKIAEDALIESQSRFKLLVDVSIEGIFLHKKGNIIDVNPAFCNITGYSEKELIGYNLLEKVIPETFHNFVQSKAESDTNESYEIKLKTKQGVDIDVAINSRFISEREKLRVASVRDITKEKQLQQQILQAIINTEENERKRVAQELHDGLGPVLSTVKLYTETFLKSDNEAFKAKIKDQLLLGINEALQQVSTISNNLSPHVLDDFGLKAAIERFIDKLYNVSTASFKFDYDVSNEIKKEVETTLYRVTTELINNSLKYANASLITIEIREINNMVSLNYSDDGKGFEFEAIKDAKKGMGLFNIVNRVKSLNGQVDFSKGANKGINYIIKIPNELKQ